MRKECCVCKTDKAELRPYGPEGAPICFKCAMSTPERVKETGKQFDARFNAAEKVSNVVELTENGPRPMKPGKA